MPNFSRSSEERLASCHPDLQRVARAAIKLVDFSVLCGFRGKELQDEAYKDGRSKEPWPNSRHNKQPSDAMDLAPYPIDWANREAFAYLAGIVIATAAAMGIEMEWGGHFETIVDMPHFQLKRVK